MATTTTNYGFDIPQSTDLVKDGATAIATLGQDIDTAMNTALGTKKAGMVLLNTTSFSGVATQSVNNVFTSTYRNYRVLIEISAGSADAALSLRLRASGSDQSGASYDTALYGAQGNGTAFAFGATGGTQVFIGDVDTNNSYFAYAFSIDIFRPNENDRTVFNIISGFIRQAGAFAGISGSAIYNSAYVADGFTILNSAGTNMTGKITIYGYNV